MDEYDREIERLVGSTGDEIQGSWRFSGLLFNFCCDEFDSTKPCGCLTMIRGSEDFSAFANGRPVVHLTEAIRRDARLPTSEGGNAIPFFDNEWDVTSPADRRALLMVFADRQRAMNATIRQGKPWHPEFAPPMRAPESRPVPALVAQGS